MKLARANERAFYAGREALLQRGAIVTNPNGTRYRVEHVRGSTVTVVILKSWHVKLAGVAARAAAAVARRLRFRRPTRPVVDKQ